MALASAHNPNKDFEVVSPPSDGISQIRFSPTANHILASSWDNQIRCWDVQPSGQTVPKAAFSHDGPVLCCGWSQDGARVFSGGCDRTARMWDLATNQQQGVGQHDAPIKELRFVPDVNGLVTGSWDKTVRMWDCRTPTPQASLQMPDRVYAMDVAYPMCVVGCAERHILVYDLRNPSVPHKNFPSPLRFQTRCVTIFPDITGFAIGSIEGRVSIQYIDESQKANTFAFKCHRDGNDVYAVNDIAFHPGFGTFSTVGSDGVYNFWDKDSKQRLKFSQRSNTAITSCHFSRDGSIFAYALSYDWHKGAEYYNPTAAVNSVLLHPCTDQEIRPRRGRKR